MGWWDIWRNRSFTARDANSPLYYGGSNSSGEIVTPDTAMKISAFWSCVSLISQTIATLPIGIYERGSDGEKIAKFDHRLYRILRDSPNADQTAVEFWEGRILGLCTTGNGFAEKKRNAAGDLVSLERMPADTRVTLLDNGSLEYRYSYLGKEHVLEEDDVFHIRAFGDGYMGLSPVAYGAETLGLALATDKASGQVFSKGMRAKGFFTFPGVLKPDQRTQIQKNLVDTFSGTNGKDWGVLEGGVDIKTVNINPRDAELILSRKFNVEDICRWLRVPPILIGHAAEGQTMWGTGIEQILIGWLTLGLSPYLKRIEQAIKKRLIGPSEPNLFAEFNIDGLLRGDSASRGELYWKLVQLAAMTPNDVCDKENFKRFDGGDVRLINQTLTPLKAAVENANQPPAPSQPPQNIAVSLDQHIKRAKRQKTTITKHDAKGRVMEYITEELE